MPKIKLNKCEGGQQPHLFWVQVNLYAITGSNGIRSTDVPTSEIYICLLMWEQARKINTDDIRKHYTQQKKHGNTAVSWNAMRPL